MDAVFTAKTVLLLLNRFVTGDVLVGTADIRRGGGRRARITRIMFVLRWRVLRATSLLHFCQVTGIGQREGEVGWGGGGAKPI